MTLFFSAFAVLYILFVIGLIYHWRSIPETAITEPAELSISVIIPSRNEEDRISLLLADLTAQNYPTTLFEIIVVNDHSEDNTSQIAKEYLKNAPFKSIVIDLQSGSAGKKDALLAGITAASGEVILTTDADCRVEPSWLKSVAASFHRETVMLCGPVSYFPGSNLLEKMLEIELCSLVVSGAVTLRNKIPSMCNGANLAYRKSAFFQVQGFQGNENIMSGDDEFLMHKMFSAFPGKVRFLKDRRAVVRTKATGTIHELLEQRKRWAGKWKKYSLVQTKIFASSIFLANLIFLFLGIFTLAGFIPVQVFCSLLAGRIVAEYVFLQIAMNFFGKKLRIHIFLIMQAFYPLYVVFFGLIGQAGTYSWKGRKIESYVRY